MASDLLFLDDEVIALSFSKALLTFSKKENGPLRRNTDVLTRNEGYSSGGFT
jgi:hypothetical protein